MTSRADRIARLARLATVVTTVLFLATAPIACSETLPRVTIYGDSLSFESKDELHDQLRGDARLNTVVQGGAALCDALPQMAQDLDRRKPNIALVQFSGNNITDCMHLADGRPLEGSDLVAKYASDAEQAVSMMIERDVIVYLVGSPNAKDSTVPASINAEFERIANRHAAEDGGVYYVDAGAAVLTPAGGFTPTLPCLPTETPAMGCNDGRIVVRAPDGIHFCPTQSGGTELCPEYASGAHRFAAAMAQPVLERLREGILGRF